MVSAVPFVLLLLWVLPLLLLHGPQQSLMAFDEVHYAGRAKLMLDSGNWINPWLAPHHKTPGYYWLVAIAFQLLGINETAARAPNFLSGIIATLLVYAIGKKLFDSRVGLLAALVLNVQFIWLQYCRLSAPDIPLVTLVLLSIFSLLRAEDSQQAGRWRLLAGISLGLGFIIRSYVSFLPIVALLPYLILNHRRHHHLRDWRLYVGYGLGLLPTIAWLLLEWTQFQLTSLPALFGFAADLSSSNRHGGGWYYYLWNLTLNAFPWSLFAILGGVLVGRRWNFSYRSLCLGFPLLLLLEISLVSTRTPRYSLAMYPFMALLAAVALQWLSQVYSQKNQAHYRWVLRAITYFLGALGGILIALSFLRSLLVQAIPEVAAYLSPAILLAVVLLGLCWLSLPVIYTYKQGWIGAQYWLASLLIGPWLAFAFISLGGLLGDYNADLKAAIAQPEIAEVLNTQTVDFVWPEQEYDNKRLYRFYTPSVGQEYTSFQQVIPPSTVWIKVEPENEALITQCRSLPAARGWRLVFVAENCNQP